jgi:hypothetical protein
MEYRYSILDLTLPGWTWGLLRATNPLHLSNTETEVQ